MKGLKLQEGFTLVEIMIVIVILGILIAAGLGSFLSTQTKGRDSRRKNDLTHIAASLEAYYNDKGKYPGDSGGSGSLYGCSTGDASLCAWGGQFSDSKGTIYMVTLPTDPSPGRQYYYRKSGSGYQLYAALENTQDASYNANGYAGTNCAIGSTLVCTYGVASTNLAP